MAADRPPGNIPTMTNVSTPTHRRPCGPNPFSGEALVRLRQRMQLNQSQFWRRFGTTQSGGSRYESGRKPPGPVRILLTLATADESDAQALLQALRAPGAGFNPKMFLGDLCRHARIDEGEVRLGERLTFKANQQIALQAGEHQLTLSVDGVLALNGRPLCVAPTSEPSAVKG